MEGQTMADGTRFDTLKFMTPEDINRAKYGEETERLRRSDMIGVATALGMRLDVFEKANREEVASRVMAECKRLGALAGSTALEDARKHDLLTVCKALGIEREGGKLDPDDILEGVLKRLGEIEAALKKAQNSRKS